MCFIVLVIDMCIMKKIIKFIDNFLFYEFLIYDFKIIIIYEIDIF